VESVILFATSCAWGHPLRLCLLLLVFAHPNLFYLVRGWALINGLVLKADAPLKSLDIVKAATSEGLLLVPAGPTVVRFVPPLIVSAAEVEEALTKLAEALEKLTKALKTLD
ncbi:MAG: aminotransferase class III-fold pyridoxal phosphate-dependent enzyme, partial [Leptolyngbyaceae cyanobacterium]